MEFYNFKKKVWGWIFFKKIGLLIVDCYVTVFYLKYIKYIYIYIYISVFYDDGFSSS